MLFTPQVGPFIAIFDLHPASIFTRDLFLACTIQYKYKRYLENTDTGQRGHGHRQHANSNPNCHDELSFLCAAF